MHQRAIGGAAKACFSAARAQKRRKGSKAARCEKKVLVVSSTVVSIFLLYTNHLARKSRHRSMTNLHSGRHFSLARPVHRSRGRLSIKAKAEEMAFSILGLNLKP